MNTKFKSIYQHLMCCSLAGSFSHLMEAGGMRLFIFIVTLFFSLQSCEEKDELEAIEPTTPVIENPEYSSIVMEGLPDRRGIIKKGYLFGVPVTYEEIDGMTVFEGDIMLSPAQLAQGESIENGRTSGAGNAAADHRWPNNTVYYTIDPNLPDKQRVKDAILMWNVYSNLTFVESSSQPNRIKFVKAAGCFSNIGMIGGEQLIKVGPGCTAGNVMHEIGHAVGLFHEHSRSDRDKYININWSNIHDTLWYAFDKYAQRVNEDGIPYFMGFDHGQFDFGSIMMYPRHAFALNKSIPTITKKDGSSYTAQRDLPSQGDFAIVNDLYPKPFISVNGPFAQDISAGADGTVYMISKAYYNNSSNNPYGYSIYKWLGSAGWTKEQNMGAIAMDVAPDGTPWVVTKNNQIYRKVGTAWQQVPGNARDIGIGANGSIYIIGTTPVTGGYRVYRKNETGWFPMSGMGGVAIDVTAQGKPWVITSDKQIYYQHPQGRSISSKAPGWGYEITSDSENGIYMLSGIGTNHSLYKWTGSKWLKQPGQGVKISAGQKDKVWIVKSDGTIYRRD